MQLGRTGLRQSVCGPQTLRVSSAFLSIASIDHEWRLTDIGSPHLDAILTTLNLFAEWRIVDLALSLYGKVVVPLYENFGPDSIGASVISSLFAFPADNSKLSPEYMCVSRLQAHRLSLTRVYHSTNKSASNTRTSVSSLSSFNMCPHCSTYPPNFRPSRQSSFLRRSPRLLL